MNARREVAKAAEDAACDYLLSLGWRILRRNLYGSGGEIDIVAFDGTAVVFVEVKARTNHAYGSALAAVDARKRSRIRSIAADFLQVAAPQAKARFDVIVVDRSEFKHYRGAF